MTSPIDESMVAQKYDSWGPEGINFEHLLQFINETYHRYQERESHWYYQNYGPFLGVVALSSGGVPRLFLSKHVLNRRNRGDIVKKRFRKMLPHFQDALANATTPASSARPAAACPSFFNSMTTVDATTTTTTSL